MDANTLAKMANGLCDNTLTAVLRCWEFGQTRKRLILCPAMNTMMWEHPITKQHLEAVKAFDQDILVIPPISKTLMCGDIGLGAMANVNDIIETIKPLLAELE